jgi:ferritin-like protein
LSSDRINVVGVNVLTQNGLDVQEVIKGLVYNASVEFTAYYYFTNLRAHCTGLDGEGVKGVIEDARLEDLSHFESCIQRIYELGGILPNDAIEFVRMSGCEFLQLPTPHTNLQDPGTYDIAKDILKEEIEHEAWFLELLHGRPSGHMRRRYAGERPHTSGHSRSLGNL